MDTNLPLISYLSAIFSRLSYFDNDQFLIKYNTIFNIPSLQKQLVQIEKTNTDNIFDIDLQNMSTITKKVNTILRVNIPNSLKKSIQQSENIKYICISNSNYSSVYIIRDKRTQTIVIAFRGTYSAKSAISYLKVTSIEPFVTCENGKDKGILLGIFKIVGEIFYTIQESIRYLSEGEKYKIITTGHSLGGAAAHIYSYLYTKHRFDKKTTFFNKQKIVCVTFGSPRVMNYSLMDEYTKFIENKDILFRRYITNGDIFPTLPITSKSGNVSYYHVEEQNDKLNNLAFSCVNYKKTNKVKCKYKNKTKKISPSVKYHATYLGISFNGAAQDLTNIHKEIIRKEITNNTICRIIIGGNNEPYKVVFYNLDEAKRSDENIFTKVNKLFITDYNHQDIYITQKMFNVLLKNATHLEEDKLNKTQYNTLVPIQHKNKNKELFCFD